MAYLGKGRREDSFVLATELNLKFDKSMTIATLKDLIISSEDYDEELTKNIHSTIVEDRKAREENLCIEEQKEKLLIEEREEKLRFEQLSASESVHEIWLEKNHLDDFTRGRIIGKLEEGRTVTSVAAEFGINKSVVSRAWKAFQTTGTAVRKVGGGRPRTTTAGDDRYIILQAKRGRRHSASVIAQQLSTATGRQVSRFTVARRLHKGGLFTRRPERCLPLKVEHRRLLYSGAESTKTGQLSMESCPLYR
ncbi:transposable element Tcb2 transposase [Trichonephila clavipes]|nr:transposable element Tcb2 transposase [Trichonephila clavipes]